MYKYGMDPTRTVGATEQTLDMDGRADKWTDWQMDGRTEWNQYTPPTTSLCEEYNKKWNEVINKSCSILIKILFIYIKHDC